MFELFKVVEFFPKMLETFVYTIWVVIGSVFISFALAVPIAVIRIKKIPLISQFCEVWLSFIRSMPGILELFLAYFVLPGMLDKVGIDTSDWSGTTFVLIAMVFHYAPFISEILRPAYLSVDIGQHEAAASIGLTGFQTFVKIIAPQTLPVALPLLCNAAIDTVKDTSLLFTIGVIDLMGKADLIIADSYGMSKMEAYLTVAIYYWILTVGVIAIFRQWEKFFKKYKLSTGIKLKS